MKFFTILGVSVFVLLTDLTIAFGLPYLFGEYCHIDDEEILTFALILNILCFCLLSAICICKRVGL